MKKKGISLIVLIITIVVIIILATAIIVNIANTNVIDNSQAAVFKSDVAAMQEELSMYIADEYTDALGKYDSRKLQATEDGIWYGSTQQEGTITDIIKSMNKKYVGKLFIQDGKLVANKMNVTVEEEKWLEDIGVTSITQTDIGVIKIIPSTDDWTNGNISLTIEYSKEIPEGYVIEYKLNGSDEWQEGTQVIVESNTTVKARLYSEEKKNEALSNSYTVSKIDKEAPDITNMIIDITTGTNSITAVASGAIDDLSGLEKYQYSVDRAIWQDSGVFNGYKNATEVTVYAKAIDKVGNESESILNTGTTTGITGTIQIKPNITECTKENVTVTLSCENIPSGYAMQYKIDSGNWTNYTSELTITENNTKVYARIYNNVLDDEVLTNSYTVLNIDKDAPTVGTLSYNAINCTTINLVLASATDDLSKISKIVWYYKTASQSSYSSITTSYSAAVSTITANTSKEITVSYNTDYTAYAEVYDVVGNKQTTNTITAKGNTTHNSTTGGSLKTAATCTTAAEYYHKCSRCSTQLTTTYTSGNAKGHTSANGGTSGVHTKCSVCGVTISTSHSYSSSVAIAATCTTKGTTKYTCGCGYSYTSQNIAELGHNYVTSNVTKNWTVTSIGQFKQTNSQYGEYESMIAGRKGQTQLIAKINIDVAKTISIPYCLYTGNGAYASFNGTRISGNGQRRISNISFNLAKGETTLTVIYNNTSIQPPVGADTLYFDLPSVSYTKYTCSKCNDVYYQ